MSKESIHGVRHKMDSIDLTHKRSTAMHCGQKTYPVSLPHRPTPNTQIKHKGWKSGWNGWVGTGRPLAHKIGLISRAPPKSITGPSLPCNQKMKPEYASVKTPYGSRSRSRFTVFSRAPSASPTGPFDHGTSGYELA